MPGPQPEGHVGLAQLGFHRVERRDVGQHECEGLLAREAQRHQDESVTAQVVDRVAPEGATSNADLHLCGLCGFEEILGDHQPNFGLMVLIVPLIIDVRPARQLNVLSQAQVAQQALCGRSTCCRRTRPCPRWW